MANQNVCEVILDQLAAVGVKQLFGMTGDALNSFLDALRRDGRFEWIGVRHEETAAFAAAAQAKMSNKLAVCCGTTGPGAIHLINGLYDAKRDRAPVLAITGHVPLSEQGTGFFQEVDIKNLFQDVCVYNEFINSPKQLPRVIQQAIKTALLKGGVAHVSIPTDIIAAEVPKSPLTHTPIVTKFQTYPCTAETQHAANLINANEKICILAGDGCRDAKDELLSLAALANAPVVHSLKGTDVVEYKHPNWVGGIGYLGTPQGLMAMDECDVFIMLGSDFPFSAFLPKNKEIIQVDINPDHLGRRCPVTVGIVGHLQPSLSKLLPLIQQKKDTDFLDKINARREKWDKYLDSKADLAKAKIDKIPPQAVTRAACELASDNAVFIADVGLATGWAARHLRLRAGQRLIGSFNHGSLGVSVPAAIGVQLQDKKRQVVALAGDGGFNMMMQDFVTAVRYELPITYIVYNNEKLGFIELEMRAAGLPKYGTKLVNPDYAAIAEACGGVGISLNDPAELRKTIADALALNKPCIIDVKVNPNEVLMPPKLEAASSWGYSVAMLKEVFTEEESQ